MTQRTVFRKALAAAGLTLTVSTASAGAGLFGLSSGSPTDRSAPVRAPLTSPSCVPVDEPRPPIEKLPEAQRPAKNLEYNRRLRELVREGAVAKAFGLLVRGIFEGAFEVPGSGDIMTPIITYYPAFGARVQPGGHPAMDSPQHQLMDLHNEITATARRIDGIPVERPPGFTACGVGTGGLKSLMRRAVNLVESHDATRLTPQQIRQREGGVPVQRLLDEMGPCGDMADLDANGFMRPGGPRDGIRGSMGYEELEERLADLAPGESLDWSKRGCLEWYEARAQRE